MSDPRTVPPGLTLPRICANCHAAIPAGQAFCGQCGQPAQPRPPSALGFVREFVTHYVSVEGALWRTLGRLFFSPGHLTRAWIDGRRTQYVPPLRLYLTASIIFFLLLKFTTSMQVSAVGSTALPERPLGDVGDVKVTLWPSGGTGIGSAIRQWLAPTEARLNQRVARMTPTEAAAFARDYMLSRASYTMFFLLPFFALLLKLAYWRRGLAYGAHGVFALHLHAFLFGVFIVLALPWPGPVEALVLAAVPLYLLLALKRVYGGRWMATLLRAAAVSIVYSMGFLFALLALAGSVVFAL